ncbi:hypothetical protein FF1_003609 [Malus domestica]
MALDLLAWFKDKLNNAVAASFLPRTVPFCRTSTKGGIPFKAPTSTLFSPSIDKLNNVAAEFPPASSVPCCSISTIPGIDPSLAMSLLFASSIDKFKSAVTV